MNKDLANLGVTAHVLDGLSAGDCVVIFHRREDLNLALISGVLEILIDLNNGFKRHGYVKQS